MSSCVSICLARPLARLHSQHPRPKTFSAADSLSLSLPLPSRPSSLPLSVFSDDAVPNRLQSSSHFHLLAWKEGKFSQKSIRRRNPNSFRLFCCSSTTDLVDSNLPYPTVETTETPKTISIATKATAGAAGVKQRKRYRRERPGEAKGIVEEMRFIAMRLRDRKSRSSGGEGEEMKQEEEESRSSDGEGIAETWQPSMRGFLKYLVDSKLVFQTLDNIIEESDDVAYAYFRNTGLERSERLSRDLEWLGRQDIVIPEPGSPGITYADYLNKLARKSTPLFLCHFYNIYFAHVAGGQVIVKQVCDRLLEGREMEFCKWDGDVQVLLKDTRENLNKLAEYWSRDEKNKCLKETAKSFNFSGQIVRLIVS